MTSRDSLNKTEKALRQKKLLQQEVLMYQRIMEGMRQGLPFDDVLKLLVTSVTEGLGYDRAGIFLIQPDGVTTQLAMGIDTHGKFEKGTYAFTAVESPNNDPFSDIIFRYKRFFLSNNVPKRRLKGGGKQKLFGVDQKVLNHAIVPLEIGKDNIVGLLAVDNLFRPRFISNSDIAVLVNFATQAGMAIESFRLHEKITNLTVTDPLTGVFNRRYFDNNFASEISRCKRYNRPCGLLYVDIDHFKRVNDRWGHSVGDEVLKNVAVLLRSQIRNLDTVSRIGGEEFAVVLPETPVEGVKIVAQRLVEGVAGASVAIESEKVTVSIGVSCFPQSAQDPPDLVNLADKSLYAAKNDGRNRVGPFLP